MKEMTASRKNGMPLHPERYKKVVMVDKIENQLDLISKYFISSLKCNQLT